MIGNSPSFRKNNKFTRKANFKQKNWPELFKKLKDGKVSERERSVNDDDDDDDDVDDDEEVEVNDDDDDVDADKGDEEMTWTHRVPKKCLICYCFFF